METSYQKLLICYGRRTFVKFVDVEGERHIDVRQQSE